MSSIRDKEELQRLRDSFEVWIQAKSYYTKAKMCVRRRSDGYYYDFRVNDRWIAYCAGYDLCNRTAE